MNLKNLNKVTSSKYFIVSVFIVSTLLTVLAFYFRDFFEHSKGLGYLGIFLINFFGSATFFVSGPAFLTVIAGGGIYNPLLVAIIASLGASFGDLISFFVGYSGRKLANHKLEKKPWFQSLEQLFKRFGLLTVFVFALIPNPVFDAVGLIAGVFGINIKKFFIAVLLGRFARFILLALIGAKFY